MSENTIKKTRVMREVCYEEVASLRDRMSQYLPHSAAICGILDTKLHHPSVKELSTTVYIPESPWPSSLVVATPGCSSDLLKSLTVFWSQQEESDEDLALLLASLPSCRWNEPLFFYGCPIYVLRKLESLLNCECLASGQTIMHRISEGLMYSLCREDLQQYQLPEGFTVGSLRAEDIDTLQSWWKYNWSESALALASLLSHLPSIAVFKEAGEGDAGGGDRRLVSWIHHYKNGSMGNTFTLPEYRRLGLARCATLALAYKNIESGRRAYVFIDEVNTDSILFHEKTGFKKQCGIGWNVSLPRGVALEDVIPVRND
ncbi:uncharacterized protein LOC122257950 [Penaeus japonicus]|uniref:uncharacterized protein LOC122257950 n=1 Tax=Penaeus japonicus TaxID=27405 RepID=UPI001C70B080|nr:uncharacterized protein LOC122257950 [Penaeus japonicus]XP_042879496.1 uncharacterized protein LOC122257950 [Penaeus japonicus]